MEKAQDPNSKAIYEQGKVEEGQELVAGPNER
jgi:hypothetical protein